MLTHRQQSALITWGTFTLPDYSCHLSLKTTCFCCIRQEKNVRFEKQVMASTGNYAFAWPSAIAYFFTLTGTLQEFNLFCQGLAETVPQVFLFLILIHYSGVPSCVADDCALLRLVQS
jgi:hypothetical protein